MTAMPDLGPAARHMVNLLSGLTDHQLTARTPCDKCSLGDLVDHVGGLSHAFAAAAAKDIGAGTSGGPSADAARLGDDWRTRIPQRVLALAQAWRDPAAWTGMTQAGGLHLPAEMAGRIALNELVLHGWDVASAAGLPYDCDPQALDVSMEFVSMMSTPGEEAGREGLFGPVVDVPSDAPLLDRVLGLSGRDPSWTAG